MHSRSNQELLPTLKVCTGSTQEWACPQADAGRLRAPCPLLQNCFLLVESERGGVSWHPLVTPSGSIVSIVSPSPVVTGMVLVKLKESHSKTRHHESWNRQVGRRMVKRYRKRTTWVHCAHQRNCQNSHSVSKQVSFPKLECKPLPVFTSLSFFRELAPALIMSKPCPGFAPPLHLLATPLLCFFPITNILSCLCLPYSHTLGQMTPLTAGCH